MKYRFRRADTQKRARPHTGIPKRFAGRHTLTALHPLPQPIENIRISDDDLKHSRRGHRRSQIRARLKRIKQRLLLLVKELFAKCKALASRSRVWLAARMSNRKKKTIDSLPVLAGAALSSFLVCAFTAAFVIASLFLPYVRRYETVTVPLLQGQRIDEIDLENGCFNLLIQYETNPEVAEGRIISQSPAAGVTRKLYGKDDFCDIFVTVSKSSSKTVPTGLVGSSLRDASLSLLNNELTFTVKEEYSDKAKGTVINTYPSEGATLSSGGNVTLTVSVGERVELTDVPSLSGLTESEALQRIHASGLEVGEITYVRSERRAGTVISQLPSANNKLTAGSPVSLTISAGEDFLIKAIPDLYGMSVEDAEQKLHSVGLTVSAVYSVASAAPKGTVIYQYPLPDTVITSSVNSVELHISN